MATISELVRRRSLAVWECKLQSRRQPMRRIYVTQGFQEWARTKLPLVQATHWGGQIPVRDQIAGLIKDYVSGEKLLFTEQLNYLDPAREGVWELKTGDIRIFGLFNALDCFVASIGADANYIKKKPKVRYQACIDFVKGELSHLDLDEPKYISSGEPRDVISD